MKTKNKMEASAPANVRPSYSVPKTDKPQQEAFVQHCENRKLSTDAVLNYLRAQFPKQYEAAEVVGKWIWLESPAKTKRLASALWLLGFHWNERRNVWQHPCGRFDPIGSHPNDPRAKYLGLFNKFGKKPMNSQKSRLVVPGKGKINLRGPTASETPLPVTNHAFPSNARKSYIACRAEARRRRINRKFLALKGGLNVEMLKFQHTNNPHETSRLQLKLEKLVAVNRP